MEYEEDFEYLQLKMSSKIERIKRNFGAQRLKVVIFGPSGAAVLNRSGHHCMNSEGTLLL